jgi:protein phosphatase
MTIQAATSNLIEIAGLTDPGRVREINEDTWASTSLPTGEVVLVADGMGGHRSGEVASALARDSLLSGLKELNLKAAPPESLARSFQRANLAVYQQAMRRSESRGMGTTMTAVFLDGKTGIVGHVGDSRAYLIRNGKIEQLTRDHSWVAEKVRQGLLTEQEAREHKWRNVITNALGSYPQLRLDLFSTEIRQGDTLVLCSDGLSNMMSDQRMLEIIESNALEPAEDVARMLVQTANNAGGPDNITVVLVRIMKLANTREPSYRLPTLSERPGAVIPDPEPDATTTMIINPIRPSHNPRLWLWGGLLAVLVFVFFLYLNLLGGR